MKFVTVYQNSVTANQDDLLLSLVMELDLQIAGNLQVYGRRVSGIIKQDNFAGLPPGSH
jgi:hypothetical protein